MNTNKQILYVGGFEVPDKNAAALRVSVIGKMLREIGFDVAFLGINSTPQSQNQKNENDSIWVVNYPNTLIEWIKYSSSIKKIKVVVDKEFKTKPSAIIAYNYPSFALLRLKHYCKKNEIPLVGDITEWSYYSDKKKLAVFKKIDTFFRMRWINKSLDGLIVISSFLFKYYNTKSINIILLPPLVDGTEKKWKSSNNGTVSDVVELVYAGSPGDGKKDRLDFIIMALNKVRADSSFRLTIIGLAQEQCLVDFGVGSLPEVIKNHVSFKGRLSHLDAIKLIQSSDFSIFIRQDSLSTKAGFPTKFVESIACGTPVITNDTSNIKDYLFNSDFGYLLDDATETTLVESLNKAINLPRIKIEDMKRKCLNSNVFTYHNHMDDFEVFIKKTIDLKKRK